MAKIVLDAREMKLWNSGDKEFQRRIADAINQLAGDLGGYGIDLVGPNGQDLSLDDNEFFFQYMDPTKKYKPAFGSKYITFSSLKDN